MNLISFGNLFTSKTRCKGEMKRFIIFQTGNYTSLSGNKIYTVRYTVLLPASQIHSYLLSYISIVFSTPDFRNAFLKTIRQIIRESVRNMSLPAPETAISNCREPIKMRQTWEPKEDRSSRRVHYSPHIMNRNRDYKDEQKINERHTIGNITFCTQSNSIKNIS